MFPMTIKSYQRLYAPFQLFWNAWISDPPWHHNHYWADVLLETMPVFLQEIHCVREMVMESNPSLEHVSVVAISNMSSFCLESLIFGIEGQVCRGRVVCNVIRRWKLVINCLISQVTSKPVQRFIYYHIHACGRQTPDSFKCMDGSIKCIRQETSHM